MFLFKQDRSIFYFQNYEIYVEESKMQDLLIDTMIWYILIPYSRRNENLMGTRASIGKQQGAFTIIGDDPKKYQAAMVEYTKERVRWPFMCFFLDILHAHFLDLNLRTYYGCF